jgi:hypothetical protein
VSTNLAPSLGERCEEGADGGADGGWGGRVWREEASERERDGARER